MLVQYKESHGDCLVSQRHQIDGIDLGGWASRQRNTLGRLRVQLLSEPVSKLSDKQKVSLECIKRLDGIGFIWDVLAYEWEQGFDALSEYKVVNEDCLVPQGFVFQDFGLGGWTQRQRFILGSIRDKLLSTPESQLNDREVIALKRIKRLDGIGFVWDPYAYEWEQGFNELVKYQKANGDCSVSKGHRVDGIDLGGWVSTQRNRLGRLRVQLLSEPISKLSDRDKISLERIKRLDGIGFVWDPYAYAWEQGFNGLVKYQKANGDYLFSQRHQIDGIDLGGWASRQRNTLGRLRVQLLSEPVSKLSDKQKVSLECIKRLDGIGFVWGVEEFRWERSFSALVEYKKANGDCLVSHRYPVDDFDLGSWVSNMRHRKNRLAPERIKRLDAIGFVWRVERASRKSKTRSI